ncbi:tripartite tricarboxylate transporter TctB family protein [Roseateles oligotrophus]|uniref:Tripartite tricarboxylate transporter TctB family protein n=1 Tax=Roseateles oligotrophus TaxID=1769250 RepID=A0ABT2YGD8_9BURK|nr:tripartite tricarboxylate transporter TctB family protein [Roseateles oligotrophus]MCV2369111.1 tripartite tricarboxylate transporter TctB family protein [Roseateles oligotrophus]
MSAELEKKQAPALATRWVELGVAGLLLVLAVLVIVDSLRVGRGWADDGPRAGYFPFYIGIGLAFVSGLLILQQLLRWRADSRVFVKPAEAAGVWAVFWPMLIYVGLIQGLGIYVASALLLVFFMRLHGGYAWWKALLLAPVMSVILFFVFELRFMVPLPKGPLEQFLGF